MSISNIFEVFAHGEYRCFNLVHDEITSLPDPIDLLILSSHSSEITGRTPGTVIHTLREKAKIYLEQLKETPELDLTQQLNFWISREIENNDIRRIMCIQYDANDKPEHITEQAFRALPILESRGVVLGTIGLPVLGTGSQGLEPETLVPAIIAGAEWCMETLKSLRTIYFVDHNEAHVRRLNLAMDNALHRARVTLPEKPLYREIKEKFEEWPKKFRQKDPNLLPVLAELRDEMRGECRATHIGFAGRKIREHVIRAISPKIPKHSSQKNEYKELGDHGIADWVISYLQVLRIFGNEQAHQIDVGKRFPRQIVEQDLVMCLLAINRILDFWFDFDIGAALVTL